VVSEKLVGLTWRRGREAARDEEGETVRFLNSMCASSFSAAVGSLALGRFVALVTLDQSGGVFVKDVPTDCKQTGSDCETNSAVLADPGIFIGLD
jgi:hypothetical protein